MRKLLDHLYQSAAVLAALFLIGLLIMVLLSMAGRLLHFHVPGTDAYAGYLMAGSGFLALAHTLKRGEHIRVTLLINALTGRSKRGLELWALAAGTGLTMVVAYFSCKLAWQSLEFKDMSTGNDATPLWIPQLAMAAGSTLFAIALLDEFWLELTGHRRAQGGAEALRNE